MSKALDFIKKEFLHVLPAVTYFFIAFSLIELTFGRMLEREGVHALGLVGTVVAAGIVGKVLIVIDNFRFVDAFREKPLIYNILWKTFIYDACAFIVRVIEKLVPFISEYRGNIRLAWQHSLNDTSWQMFWTVNVWVFLLFLVFVTCQETIDRIGRDEFRKMFFGK